MKKLDVTLTFSGAQTTTKTLTGVDKKELNNVWRAMYAALGYLCDASDVDGYMDLGPESDAGRQDLTISYEVKESKKSESYAHGSIAYVGMNQYQQALTIAAFDNAFAKAGIDWH